MSRWDDLLNEEPSAEFNARLMKRVEAEMAPSPRRKFLWWLAPVALGVAGVLSVRLWKNEKAQDIPEDMLAMADVLEEEDDLTLLEEIDLLDNLEELEEWTS